MQGKRSESKTENREPRVQKVLRVVLRSLIVLAALLLALLLVLKYDSLTPEALRKVLSGKEETVAGSYSERLTFAANSLNTYAAYRGGIAVLSPSGLEIQDGSGEQATAVTKVFSHPVLVSAGGTLAAYDAGGTSFVLVKDGEAVQDISYPNTIIAADAAADGMYAIAAEESGVRAAVTVYTAEGKTRYKYFSAERFIVACALDDSSEKLALAGVRQEDAHIISAVMLMSLDREEPLAVWECRDELVLAVEFLSEGRILAITETRAVFLDADGEYAAEYAFGALGFSGWTEGSDFVVFCHSEENLSKNSRVTVLDCGGEELGGMSVGGLVGICAAGDELGILTNDAVVVYNKEMERIVQRSLVGGSRTLLLGDGTVMALSADAAYVYTYR